MPSQAVKLLGIFTAVLVIFSFSSVERWSMLYFNLLRLKLEIRNYITAADANKLESIHRKFADPFSRSIITTLIAHSRGRKN